MKKRIPIKLIVLIAVIGSAAVCYWISNRRTPSAISSPQSVRSATEEKKQTRTEQEDEKQRRTDNLLVSRFKRMKASLKEKANENPMDAVEIAIQPEELAKLAIMKRAIAPYAGERLPGAFEALVEEEQFNYRWTTVEHESMVELLDNDALINSTLKNVSCYEMLCRIEISHRDDDARSAFSRFGLGRPGMDGPATIFNFDQPDGHVESTIYMGRYGNDQAIDKRLTEHLYEDITGRSANDVVPTKTDVDAVLASFDPSGTTDNSNGVARTEDPSENDRQL